MKEVRFHGRGGQGAVTAAMILSVACFKDGKFTQAFPRFGVERRGAPVEAFTRISDSFIRRKSAVYEPDVIVVLDSTLLGAPTSAAKESMAHAGSGLLPGLKKGGLVIINTNKTADELGLSGLNVKTLDVSKVAMQILGREIVNTAMLGAYAAFTGDVSLQGIEEGIKEQFSGSLAEKNISLVKQVYEQAIANRL